MQFTSIVDTCTQIIETHASALDHRDRELLIRVLSEKVAGLIIDESVDFSAKAGRDKFLNQKI